MRTDFFFDSNGIGKIHCVKWVPDSEIKGIVQIIHGIAETVERYDDFAHFLNEHGFAVVAEDHMGHGQSINGEGVRGFFHGGWFAAVEDTIYLGKKMRTEYPDVPYFLFGHSMGSFMARTILCRYPEMNLAGAIICGTGWQPKAILPIGIGLCNAVCKKVGEKNPSEWLQNFVFGFYNKKVEHPRTAFDWLTRDAKIVDAYIADPLCGFTASAGLLRDMMTGIRYIQQPKSLDSMNKKLPIFFIAGGDDPVGNYGEGVRTAAEAFRKVGMEKVADKIYPMCRHEILNEINKTEVYADVIQWISAQTV